MARRKVRKLSKKESKAAKKSHIFDSNQQQTNYNTSNQTSGSSIETPKLEKILLELPKILTVREFAEKLGLPVIKVIPELMKNGIMASINESIDFDTAVIVGDELGFDIKPQKEEKKAVKNITEEEKKHLLPRPPVVVIMGHVDHGKTTLLDAIRSTNVVESESGGITQHIGAYQVKWKSKDGKISPITFLDTPGHEAFSAMRAHGANITDIAILVVAADDGVKPQTKEAISHAKAANVPIIVAINKIDKPGADIEKVKRELADLDLLPEEWGGKTIMVPVSAKQNKGIDGLLDMVLVSAEMENLQANPDINAEGVVIESHMQAGVGPIATILIQEGTLKVGQIVLIGSLSGKIRLMENYLGKRVKEAGPSMPVQIAGLKGVSDFGSNVTVVSDERMAREIISHKNPNHRVLGLVQIAEQAKLGKLKELNLIIRADVQGSLEAIKNSLNSLGTEDIKVKLISETVGDISESDINMAISSNALVLGFRVNVSNQVNRFAQEKGVKISHYDVIYNLIDDISAAMEGLLEPEIIIEKVGKMEVLKVFYSTRNNKIVGGKVTSGKIEKGLRANIYRGEDMIGEGKITTLKMESNPVDEVLKGFECGVGIDIEKSIKPGDIIEPYKTEEIVKKLKK